MKIKDKKVIFLIIASSVIVFPLIVAAQPSAGPPGGNVNAVFNSVVGNSISGFDLTGVTYGGVFGSNQTGGSSANPSYGVAGITISDNTAYGVAGVIAAPNGSGGMFSNMTSGTTADLATSDGYSFKAPEQVQFGVNTAGNGFTLKPNGDVIPSGSANPISNVLNSYGKYVGQSAVTDGHMGGYASAQVLCNAVKAGSHVCSAKEIANSYELNATGPIATATGNAWIDNGPPAYITDLSNDCNGWTTNEPNPAVNGTVYGSIWKFDSKKALIAHCSRSLPVACCSYAQ